VLADGKVIHNAIKDDWRKRNLYRA